VTAKVGDQSLAGASRRLMRKAREGLTSRDSLFVLPSVGLSVGMLAYYLFFGKVLELLPTVFLLATVPLVALLGSLSKSTRPWIPFVTIMLCYEALWGTVGSLASARALFSVYPLDKMIWGFNLTGWVQSTFYSWYTTLITSFFYSLQLPLVAITSLALWHFNRQIFSKYVSAIVLTSYAALVTFLFLPTAPPWYLGVAHDLFYGGTSSALPSWLLYVGSMFESDKFAAFPSLHAAYAIIFAYFMVKLDRRLAFVAVPIAFAILFSTLYLGQHYLIDLIGGAVYALIPCLIVERLQIVSHGTETSSAGSST
jgi:membrane-associated phospholipid phosphatase